MKKPLIIVAAFMFVVGIAGNAMAAFEAGNIILTAYQGTHTDTSGNEAYYDLGAYDGSGLPTTAVDTGINLGDFVGETTPWSEIKVGAVGGTWDFEFNALPVVFGSDSPGDNQFSSKVFFETAYENFNLNNATFDFGGGIATSKATDAESSAQSYSNYFNKVALPGTYALTVNATGDFGAEVQLGVGQYDLNLYTIAGEGIPSLMGTLTLDTDTSNGNLWVSYTQVPIPGALVLLGSGLLTLFGIRRKKR
ncbi:MAG: hypothetical protein R6V46_18225 [Desulfatiglandaceae bacterium]